MSSVHKKVYKQSKVWIFLKKFIFVDLLTLSTLYTLRIVAGGFITNISVSIWLLSFSVFFFISLASVKRQIELLNFKKLSKKYAKKYI